MTRISPVNWLNANSLNKKFIYSFYPYSKDIRPKIFQKKYDVIYLDTGDMTPIEDVAILQLLEAHLIVSYEILNDNGIIDMKLCILDLKSKSCDDNSLDPKFKS